MSLSHFFRICAAVACFTACSSTVEQELDSRACQQTREFGNYGCVEIVGAVVGTQQQPLSGIIVGPVYLPGPRNFNTSYGETDASGRFKFRVYDFGPPQTSDTVSLYVRAVDPRSAIGSAPATLRDSVLVTVTITPVGRVPVATTVIIALRTP